MEDPWFVREESGLVVVDLNKAYPRYLTIIGAKRKSVKTLELARRVFTEDLRQTLGAPLHLKLSRAPEWALKKFPDETGKDEEIVRRGVGAFEQFYKALPGTPAMRVGLTLPPLAS